MRSYKVHNWVAYPAICYLSVAQGTYAWVVACFITMVFALSVKPETIAESKGDWTFEAFLKVRERLLGSKTNGIGWYGGDIKLFMLIAAYAGWIFIPAIPLTILVVYIYRRVTRNLSGLPMTPFVLTSFLILKLLSATVK